MYRIIFVLGLFITATTFAIAVEEKPQSWFAEQGYNRAGGLYMSKVDYDVQKVPNRPYRAFKRIITAGETVYVLATLPNDTKQWVIWHETGHSVFESLSKKEKRNWRRAYRNRRTFCATRYGHSSYNECFAEVYSCMKLDKCVDRKYWSGWRNSNSFQWKFIKNLIK